VGLHDDLLGLEFCGSRHRGHPGRKGDERSMDQTEVEMMCETLQFIKKESRPS
jgi:hypothetical protein